MIRVSIPIIFGLLLIFITSVFCENRKFIKNRPNKNNKKLVKNSVLFNNIRKFNFRPSKKIACNSKVMYSPVRKLQSSSFELSLNVEFQNKLSSNKIRGIEGVLKPSSAFEKKIMVIKNFVQELKWVPRIQLDLKNGYQPRKVKVCMDIPLSF